MVGLLSEFEDRLPLSPAFIKLRDEENYDKALPMEWILKVDNFTLSGTESDICVSSILFSIRTGV